MANATFSLDNELGATVRKKKKNAKHKVHSGVDKSVDAAKNKGRVPEQIYYGRVTIPIARSLPDGSKNARSSDAAHDLRTTQSANIHLDTDFAQCVARDKQGNELVPGDHIRKPMHYPIGDIAYYHDGLFLGSGRVIHYSGFTGSDSPGKIEVVPVELFGDEAEIEVVPHLSRQFSRSESIQRALSRQGESAYSLFFNNCQHFVNWCIDGSHRSLQVDVAVDFIKMIFRNAYTPEKFESEIFNFIERHSDRID